MRSGWAFLVARGRTRDYRTALVPDFLADRGLAALLADSLPIDEPGGPPRTTTIDGGPEPLAITSRAAALRPADLVDHDDHDAVGPGDDVQDEHGRPLEYLYGVVQLAAHAERDLREEDIAEAHAQALRSYRRFLAAEERFTADRSAPFPLAPPSGAQLPPVPGRATPVGGTVAIAPQPRSPSATPPRPSIPRPRPSAAPASRPAPRQPAENRPAPPRPRRRGTRGRFGSRVGTGALAAAGAGVLLVALLLFVLPRWSQGPLSDLELAPAVPAAEQPCSAPLTVRVSFELSEPATVRFRWEPSGGERSFSLAAGQHTRDLEARLPGEERDGRGELTLVAEIEGDGEQTAGYEYTCRLSGRG